MTWAVEDRVKRHFLRSCQKFKKIRKTFLQEQVKKMCEVLIKFSCNLRSKLARSTLTSPGSIRVTTSTKYETMNRAYIYFLYIYNVFQLPEQDQSIYIYICIDDPVSDIVHDLSITQVLNP
jgi:hypothetical protein